MIWIFLVLAGGSPRDLDEGNELVNINSEIRHGNEFSTANAREPRSRGRSRGVSGSGFNGEGCLELTALVNHHVGFFSPLVAHVYR